MWAKVGFHKVFMQETYERIRNAANVATVRKPMLSHWSGSKSGVIRRTIKKRFKEYIDRVIEPTIC
jgi:hypothetical protein